MDRRIVLEDAAPGARRAPQNGRAQLFQVRRPRGPGVWRYSRGTLARLLGLRPSAIYSAERRGELQLGDLASVSRFVTRRLVRAERRRLRDTSRKLSVR